jgi:ATP-binding cassette subfamily F protein 3
MLSNANFLILDEPTNHLDITSKEILENALNSYTGTILYVSHDRYFINTTATRILELTENTLVNYVGNYDYYLEKRDILTPIALSEAKAASVGNSKTDDGLTAEINASSKESWRASREEQARLKKLKNRLSKVEERISVIEARTQEIDEEYQNPEIASNTGRLMELHKEREALDAELSELYDEWEKLSIELG